jgi:hypothetical protein
VAVLLLPVANTCPMFESVELASRPNWKLRFACAVVVVALVGGILWLLRMTQMPLRSFEGALPPLTRGQSELRDRLSSDVKYLSVTIGERCMERAGSLAKTVDYIRETLRGAGYAVADHPYSVGGSLQTISKRFLSGRTPKPAASS